MQRKNKKPQNKKMKQGHSNITVSFYGFVTKDKCDIQPPTPIDKKTSN